jgi:hypothetical protein
MGRLDLDADEALLDAMGVVVLAALEAIGDDPEARLKCVRQLLAVAEEEVSRRLL